MKSRFSFRALPALGLAGEGQKEMGCWTASENANAPLLIPRNNRTFHSGFRKVLSHD
jgi:hypothetical protein